MSLSTRIGLIPEAEGFTKVFENTAGYQLARTVGNTAGYRGVVATQYGMKVVPQGKGAVAMVNGAFGLGDTSVEGRIRPPLPLRVLYLALEARQQQLRLVWTFSHW